MQNAAIVALVAVFIFWRMRRRIRPAPVRPMRSLTYVVIVIVGSGLGLAGHYHELLTPLGAILIPVMLAAGVGLGVLLTSTMNFYDGPDRELWMSGGVVFIAIFIAVLALRLGVSFAASGGSLAPHGAASSGSAASTVSILSADLLLVSPGLWGARMVALWRRYRAHQSTLAQVPGIL